jgi:hypothetical protein
MMESENSCKLTQFDEFFTIEYPFNVNIAKLEPCQTKDFQSFLNTIPMPFKMTSDMMALDQAALGPLQTLDGVAGQLVTYLQQQSQKIDLLVSYILHQQDDCSARQQGISFGGGGITFSSEQDHALNEIVELKIFLNSENCVIYCFAEIIEITNNDHNCLYKAIYHFIRDEDREMLVRTSLHIQSKQLKQLAKQRNQLTKD